MCARLSAEAFLVIALASAAPGATTTCATTGVAWEQGAVEDTAAVSLLSVSSQVRLRAGTQRPAPKAVKGVAETPDAPAPEGRLREASPPQLKGSLALLAAREAMS